LVAGGTAVACVWATVGSRTEASEIDLASRSTFTFAVSGTDVRDLHPGAARRVRVTVTNPYSFPIKVHRVEARLAQTSQRRCKPIAANLTVGSYRGGLPVIVTAHKRTVAGEFEVRMPNTVAEACKNVKFELEFTARAGRVSR
jgi:hypothetical protein